MTESYLYSTLILLLSHLSLSTAQLTGTLTRCNHDRNLIMAVITNTHTRHVSVLKHNTIFDTSHLSLPFRIIDAAGTRLPIGMRLFHTGVSREDFLDLAPGGNFTREFNLTEYVALEPKGSERFQTIEISLPSAFRGLKDHDGVYDVHSAAKERLIDGQLRLGDVSKVNLASISHTSVPFQITLSVPIPARRSRLKTRESMFPQFTIPSGVQLVPGHCIPADAAKVSTGMLHASYLAGAALNAASKFSQLPFNFFFPGNQVTANIVAGVMTRVIQAQQGQGPHILVTCRDIRTKCVRNHLKVIHGYLVHGHFPTPIMVLCPGGLALPFNPPPCSTAPGTFSIGQLILHELTHDPAISGPGLKIDDAFPEVQDAGEVGVAVRQGRDTTNIANAYSFLGSWAWDLGLGGQPWNEQKTCLERFSTGLFNENGYS